MTTRKRKTPVRRKRTPRKKKGNSIRPFVLPLILFLFGAAATYVTFFYMPSSLPVDSGSIESVLIGANIDIADDVDVKEQDGLQHWRIKVSTKSKRKLLERALSQLAESHQANWSLLDEQKIDGAQHALFVIQTEEGVEAHRILIVIPAAKKPTTKAPKATEPKSSQYISQNTLDPESDHQIAIIIDDVGGHSVEQTTPLTDLNLPITFAVIPFLAHSTTMATYLHQNHYEVILHMPMEPGNYPASNPGEGAILSHMNSAEIEAALAKAFQNVPFVSGMNNHMGSKITANRALMREILQELKSRDLFFVDSRTHKSTVAYEMAQEMGLSSAERHVFLDTEESYTYTMGQIEIARQKADELGRVIAIGHPYPTTIRALVESMPKLDRDGYRFVFVSELVHGPEGSL